MRRIISIAACGNGSGKTTLLETVLRAFPGRLAAIKFTTVFRDGVNCPRSEAACACRELHGSYTVVRDPGRLAQEGTDTGRLVRSGASSVLWCLARPGSHAPAWDHLRRELLEPEQDCLTEGNSAIPALEPDRILVLLSPRLPRERWKPDVWPLASRASHLLINPWQAAPADVSALAEEARRRTGKEAVAQDPAMPLARWPDRSLFRDLAALLGRPEGA